jgi:hypothetical protein
MLSYDQLLPAGLRRRDQEEMCMNVSHVGIYEGNTDIGVGGEVFACS